MRKFGEVDVLNSTRINESELLNEVNLEISVLKGLDIFTNAHVVGVVKVTLAMCKKMNNTGYILKDYADAIIAACKRHSIFLIDLFNEINLDPYDQTLVPDGLHPSDKGHEVLAEFIAEKLIKL